MPMNTIASIELSLYNPEWVSIFNKEKERIFKKCKEADLLIEHIGSTATLSAVAKPEIDIMIGVESVGNCEKRGI